jgi:hypothetical protein
MTSADEDFVHYVDCIDSLNRAWSILKELGGFERPSAVQGAAFLFALVEYAKPYTRSDGYHGRRKLPPPELPESLALHEQILDLRNQVLAHSDLTVKQAQLCLHSFQGKPRTTSSPQTWLTRFRAAKPLCGLSSRPLNRCI